MTRAASTLGLAESDTEPSFPTAARAVETFAAAAVGSAIELGVVGRVAPGAVDPASVAADCGLAQQGAERSQGDRG